MGFLIGTASLGCLLFALAPYVSRQSLIVDLVSHFVLQTALGGMILLALAGVFGADLPVYAALLAAELLCLYQIWPFLFPRRDATAKEGVRIKVLHANAWMRNRGVAAFKDLILRESPDIVVAVEVNTPCAEMMESLRKEYPHQHVHSVDTTGTGVAVLSKLPPVKVKKRFLAASTIPSFFLQFSVDGKPLDVVAMHAASPFLSLPLRDHEFDALTAWHDAAQPERLILVGDLNATPYCSALRRLKRRTGMKDPREGIGFFGSFPTRGLAAFLRIPIDHILVTKNIGVEAFRLGADSHSDHLPIIAVLRI